MSLPYSVMYVSLLLGVLVDAAKLPSIVVSNVSHPHGTSLVSLSAAVKEVEEKGNWWVKLGDNVYYTPAAADSLSKNVADYYHAMGLHSALTDDLKQRRVGGTGKHHIFHIPGGPQALPSIPSHGDRRHAISALTQLKAGTVLTLSFPTYVKSISYVSSFTEKQQSKEKSTVSVITEDLVMSYLRALTSLRSSGSDVTTRSASDPAASVVASKYLKTQFQGMGYTVCEHRFEYDGVPLSNIIAYVPGAKGGPPVVVGAHYDSRPFTGLAPGAEDNGSGVAALLAMAHAFKAQKVSPARPVMFVGFEAEEQGCIGSERFVEGLTSGDIPAECRPQETTSSFLQGRHARAAGTSAIIMDEIGWLKPGTGTPMVNLESHDWTKEVMEHLAQSSATHNGNKLRVEHSSNPFGSDHMSFLNRGLQAVLTINSFDEDYPNYHQSTDTISNVNGTMLMMIAKMNMGALVRLAGMA